MRPFPALIELTRDALRFSASRAMVLFLIVIVRVLPFYVLMKLLPIADPGMQALIETAILVPAIAAIIRYVWAATSGIELSSTDALLGTNSEETLRLLGTSLLVVSIHMFFAGGGVIVFYSIGLIWGWMTLVVDPVVIVEEKTFFNAISRSIELVRTAIPITVGALAVVTLPQAGIVVLHQTLDESVMREVVTRGLTLVFLPAIVVLQTMLYERYFSQESTVEREQDE